MASKIILFFIIFLFFVSKSPPIGNGEIQLGAYYFDGWTGTYPYHITSSLKDSFTERRPKWGWITSKQKIMDEQILQAWRSNLSFFCFCWYPHNAPLNRSTSFYIKSPNRSKLKFCLLVANHDGFEIGPKDWNNHSKEWITLFKTNSYLRVNKKPLLIFFSPGSLVKNFGSTEAVSSAFDSLKQMAVKEGFEGVTIAGCIGGPNPKNVNLAEQCGFDVITGYNYHHAGFQDKKEKVVPIENMIKAEKQIWDQFKNLTSLPYIPVSTLNWDPRPWAATSSFYANSSRYIGFNDKSVYKSVVGIKNWINANEKIGEKIGFLYAWNEYGEGAWLTPSKGNGNSLLIAVRKALE